MADNRFFHNSGSLTLKDIAALTSAAIVSQGGEKAEAREFSDVSPLDTAAAHHVSFLDNTKYLDAFAASKAGACFVRRKFVNRAPKTMVLLVTEDPYTAYALTAQRFYPQAGIEPGISPHAHIAKNASIGKGSRIDHGAVIGEKATVGDGCWIGANTLIGENVSIGSNTRIGGNCTLSHALIGKNVIIHRGVHIGQDGFGFAPSPMGILKVPQLGRVIIGDDVEIGSGTCIDRGAGPDTIIGNGCKIDNLVQIGHNVQLGRFVVIAAQVGIAGSAKIDDGVMFGGQSGVAGHTHIGAGGKVAAQSGVMTDMPPGGTFGGSPAVPIRDWHRQTVAVTNLTKKMKAD